MARRKRQHLSDDDDSDSLSGSENGAFEAPGEGDADERDERALFEDPYKRKRQKRNAKDDATYGIFAESSEDEAPRKRNNWTKAPAFVSSANKDEVDDMQVDSPAHVDVSDSDNDLDPPDPEPNSDIEDIQPTAHGLGSGFSRGGIGSKNGIGKTTTSIPQFGSSHSAPAFAAASTSSTQSTSQAESTSKPATSSSSSVSADHFPSAFGAARSQAQRAFTRKPEVPLAPKAASLDAKERSHFAKLEGTFGARMLAKMGWQAGTGLGNAGEGIVTPIESKLRPSKAGLAFQGFREKTEQSRREAKRKGEVVSDDEENESQSTTRGRRRAQNNTENSAPWKKTTKRNPKTKIVHKTYEQYAEEGGVTPSPASVGVIIDGATLREVTSLADVSSASWTPSTDPMRIPEVRHNLRLITESCKGDLDGLAREAHSISTRQEWLLREDIRLQTKIKEEEDLISRLEKMSVVAEEIAALSNALASDYEASLERFTPAFSRLVTEFPAEFKVYRIDEIVVAAIAPLLRRQINQWNPLKEPTAFVSEFRTWKDALRLDIGQERKPETQLDIYGSGTTSTEYTSPSVDRTMTPFESLLWSVWLPRIRSVINNEWSPVDPPPAVRFYEAWATFLPPFIRDNMLDQLILPKVRQAVSEWNMKKDKSTPLHNLIFPWLPHLNLRLEDILGEAKRKLKSVLKSWQAVDGVPPELSVWRQVFDAAEWDNLLLKYILPKLAALLRSDFQVDPAAQNLVPLQLVIPWHAPGLLRNSIFAQLLESEFFPKWLKVLHVWLTYAQVNFGEVAQWYEQWKNNFPPAVLSLPGVAKGFTRGLQLMNKAIELGPDAPALLKAPDFLAEQKADIMAAAAPKPKTKMVAATEITFRSIVEETAATHNLLFVPTGKAHERSRMPLYRVSPTADGKGGLLVYLLDDAVWAPNEDGDFRAISLDDMVLRASR